MDFKFVDICNTHLPNNPKHIDKKPEQFETMKAYATLLARDFTLVRVDFYLIGDRIYLGEMTFSPGNAGFHFKDPKHEKMLGDMIML